MLALISENFQLHASLIPDLSEGMTVHKSDHLTYVDSGLSSDTFNIAYIHDPYLTKMELEEALNHYKSKQHDYCIWIDKESLSTDIQNLFKEFNVTKQANEIGMCLDLGEYDMRTDNRHTHIKFVDSKELLETFARVIAENWSPPDQNVLAYYNITSEHYLDPKNHIQLFVYYHNGRPASCVELFPSDNETIGFYGFATLKEFRGMGIGTTLLTFALNIAKESGYKYTVLQGTEDGLNIYKKLGFKNHTTYYEYA